MNEVIKIFKPSECSLQVNRFSYARNNGIKIEANDIDLKKIKSNVALKKAGLKVEENIKVNPHLVIHGVLAEMTESEIRDELRAQNLEEAAREQLKVVYVYPVKQGRRTRSCVVEVAPAVRSTLMDRKQVYCRFSACIFSDYVRVLQCFRC